ncbi:CENP-B N-terminal DNA-binding domain [Popillia japonica]|uniref:CENP-B N-terminal DNA-binding domain n=1 Tax=Popillia japonica TaxID=7064 RepID=A0AAW1LDU0_POPJA
MPRSKTGNHRQAVNKEALEKAIEAVTAAGDQKISLREACCVYGVELATLVRHLTTFKLNQDKRDSSTDQNLQIN